MDAIVFGEPADISRVACKALSDGCNQLTGAIVRSTSRGLQRSSIRATFFSRSLVVRSEPERRLRSIMNRSLDSGRPPLIVLRYKAPFAALTAGIIADVLATGGLGPKRDYCEEGNSRSAAAKRSTFSAYAPLSTLLAGTSSMPPRLFSGKRFHAFQHLCAALAAWVSVRAKEGDNLSLFCAMYVRIGLDILPVTGLPTTTTL